MDSQPNDPRPAESGAVKPAGLFQAIRQDDPAAVQAALARGESITGTNADVRHALLHDLYWMKSSAGVGFLLRSVNLTCTDGSLGLEGEGQAAGTDQSNAASQKPAVNAYALWDAARKSVDGDIAAFVYGEVRALPCIDKSKLSQNIATLKKPDVSLEVVEALEELGFMSTDYQEYYEQENEELFEDIDTGPIDDFLEKLDDLAFENQQIALAALDNPDPDAFKAAFEQDRPALANDNYRVSDLAYLLKQSADINSADRSGNTPLIAASGYNDDPEIVSTLLAANANTEACNELGRTPLLFAAQPTRNPAIIEALVAALRAEGAESA